MSNVSTARCACLAFAAVLALWLGTAPAQAAFGIAGFDGETLDATGAAYTQAGGHPFTASTSIQFNRTTDVEGNAIPDESVRRIEVEMPPGFVGNPRATPTRCTDAELTGGPPFSIGECPISSQVGIVHLEVEDFFPLTTVPVYNMVPAADEPAHLGIRYATTDIHISPSVRSDGDYGITATLNDVSNAIPLVGTMLTLWGVPADPRHDTQRGFCILTPDPEDVCHTDAPLSAFWTLPTTCTQPDVGLKTRLHAESWLGSTADASFVSHLPPGLPNPGPPQGPTGCDQVPFNPTFDLQTTTSAADSPTGLETDIVIPQGGLSTPNGIASSTLRDVTVTLPQGMSVNPSSANGLAACSPAEIGLLGNSFPEPNPIRFDRQPASCPDGSKLGTVSIDTPLLEDPLTGSIYLAQQGSNPFGSLLAIYIVAEGHGVTIKLPGRISTDPQTGAVTAQFSDNPQLPFERLHARFFPGDRAALTLPERCGSYAATARFIPWSGGPAVERTSQIQVGPGPGGKCPAGNFNPQLNAGTVNPIAGRFSPFLLDISRDDGTQRVGSFQATLPEGLLAKLAGVPYCPEAALGTVPTGEGSGAGQVSKPSCPASSQVGTVTVGAGSGTSPLFVRTGKVYLTGPYKGAPLSLAVVVPALAGPFDLGNVVVRTALRVDPESAQVTAATDPLPTILQGLPLDLRNLRVDIDRSNFVLNPTSCDPMQVTSTIVGTGGAVAKPSDRFQVTSCERLGFKPRLSLRLRGGTRRGQHPKLIAKLTTRKNQANIGRLSVALPHSEFLAQEHIRTVCTRVQFAADACPKGSIYGYAVAHTPLLDKPLRGPVYLRANGGARPLPDLVLALHGQIDIDVAGFIDSVHGGLRTRFQRVPDAPISSVVLRMSGGKKSLLINSTNLCRSAHRATTKIEGHNGATHATRPPLRTNCRRRAG